MFASSAWLNLWQHQLLQKSQIKLNLQEENSNLYKRLLDLEQKSNAQALSLCRRDTQAFKTVVQRMYWRLGLDGPPTPPFLMYVDARSETGETGVGGP
jgi:hypothetical protein